MLEFGERTSAVCRSRRPVEPMYETDKDWCSPRPCSNAVFHWSAYGSLRFGSNAANRPGLAEVGGSIASGAAAAILRGKVPPRLKGDGPVKGYPPRRMTLPVSEVARS